MTNGTTRPLAPESTHAVLEYLGVERAAPDLSLLDRLIEAYTRRVPWESATRIARRARVAETVACPRWPETFWREAIATGGGGTCFESNYACFSLLRALGYDGYPTINDMGTTRGCHTAIVLRLDGGHWLVDVGIPLHVPVPLDSDSPRGRQGPFHTYRVQALADDRHHITRDRHPVAEIYTLIDRPVDDAAYRAATTADYGPGGHFLDRVIVTRVVDGVVWRYSSGDRPPRLEAFPDGRRVDHPIVGGVAESVARRFEIDASVVREALRVLSAARGRIG